MAEPKPPQGHPAGAFDPPQSDWSPYVDRTGKAFVAAAHSLWRAAGAIRQARRRL